jgi:hypothetical protein
MMSFLTLAFPIQAAIPAAQTFAGTAISVARPLLGLSALAAVLVTFKPLLVGLLRAALLVLKPRRSLEERTSQDKMESVMMLDRMAREVEAFQPSLAAELRYLASRG